MEQSSSETNSSLGSQEISRRLRSPKICYRVHKGQPPAPILI
jgi:hypothetical protein